jgi:hypothetical protein
MKYISPQTTAIIYHDGKTVWFDLEDFRKMSGFEVIAHVNAVGTHEVTKAGS